ncbi:ABC transporter ATP-binding protein [Methylocapsa palsarum]|nr:ABC transporter ATP-binding protein [Methylocapsa palsarum]
MLQAINLTKRYQNVLALDSLNLEVRAGEIFCLLGANGAGKTTTLHLFLHFIAQTSGRALVDQVDVADDPLRARRVIAYLPEQVMLYPNLTGAENLDYFSRLAGHRYTTSELRALLARCGLQADAIDHRLGSYSKGMRQKVGLSIALAKQAKALLLDEPTSGLDPQAAHELSVTLADLARSGMAVLMATHDLFRVKETGTRAGIMRRGRLVAVVETANLQAADLERLYLDHMSSPEVAA